MNKGLHWPTSKADKTSEENSDPTDYQIHRIQSYNNIKPIISVIPAKESARLASFKQSLSIWIDSLKNEKQLHSMSIYFECLEKEAWTSVNPDLFYHPASLMKVPLMIACLRLAQANPAMLNQEIEFEKWESNETSQQYYSVPSEMVPGKKYSFHDLLFHMIAYSDNNASHMLSRYVDLPQVQKLFSDLGLSALPADRASLMINVADFSTIMKSIFNSSILSPEFSEYASEFLANCTFQEGIARGLPQGTKMWHKFGEWHDAGPNVELHESGVIFIGDQSYLLTVMTKGEDMKTLATLIGILGQKVHEYSMQIS